jgi:ABC-type transport system substrate-binding protein
MLMEANQDYWEEGIPFVDSIIMFAFDDTASQIAAFETKRIDDTRSASADQIKDLLARNSDMDLVEFPGTGTSYIHLNARKPPFDDPKVRQAVYLWLDRYEYIEKSASGSAFIGEWIFPGLHTGYGTSEADLLKNNLAWRPDKTEAKKRARELLAEAGWSDLSGVKVQVVPQSSSGSNLRGNQILEAQLKELGFDVEIVVMERLAAAQAFGAGDFSAGFYGGGGQSYDPASTLNRYVSPAGQRNYTGIEDPVFEKMLAEFNVTPDPVKRSQIVSEIDAYLQTGVWSMIPMYRSAVRWLRWDYLRGRFFMGGSINTFDDRVWLGSNAPGRN